MRHSDTTPSLRKASKQLEKSVMILSDLLWDHGPEPLPSQDPPMDRSWDLFQYAIRGFVRGGGHPPELNVELN